MTTANAITVHGLYDTDAVFRALVNEWVKHRRCPLPLVDRCLDFGLEAAADCARWAATEPERPVYPHPATKHGERGGASGPYPACNNGDEPQWVWCSSTHRLHAFDVPFDNLGIGHFTHPTPCAAILWLLANWQPAGGGP